VRLTGSNSQTLLNTSFRIPRFTLTRHLIQQIQWICICRQWQMA
jgi:hypothetical protein